MIKKENCENRRLYFIRGRSIVLGVYRADNGGFLGIRNKFGVEYVFEEYHYETGSPYGTVRPLKALDEILPDEIETKEYLDGSFCQKCGALLQFSKEGERGRWTHIDKEDCNVSCIPVVRENKKLFDWLMTMTNKYSFLFDRIDNPPEEIDFYL